ncbi:hypothetical protein [Streptomyces sp. 049-1]|uniref:hypothetical protein n=1 Tax=Streptomyces sp. 049-1 TaxID=2789264 RepID=UPI00398074A6
MRASLMAGKRKENEAGASAPAATGAVPPTAGGEAARATQSPAFPHRREEGAQ